MNNIIKFLQFKGKNIIFLHKNGTYYIAVKPVCEVLKIEYTRNFKNLKLDPILSGALAIQPIHIPGDRTRKMLFLPEFYFYGWLFGIKSDSKALMQYKWECYRVLYEHFHGVVTQRQELLKEKTVAEKEIFRLKRSLSQNQDFQKLNELQGKLLRSDKSLKKLDNEFIQDNLSLWEQDFVVNQK